MANLPVRLTRRGVSSCRLCRAMSSRAHEDDLDSLLSYPDPGTWTTRLSHPDLGDQTYWKPPPLVSCPVVTRQPPPLASATPARPSSTSRPSPKSKTTTTRLSHPDLGHRVKPSPSLPAKPSFVPSQQPSPALAPPRPSSTSRPEPKTETAPSSVSFPDLSYRIFKTSPVSVRQLLSPPQPPTLDLEIWPDGTPKPHTKATTPLTRLSAPDVGRPTKSTPKTVNRSSVPPQPPSSASATPRPSLTPKPKPNPKKKTPAQVFLPDLGQAASSNLPEPVKSGPRPPPSALQRTIPPWATEGKGAGEARAPSNPHPKHKREWTGPRSSPSSSNVDQIVTHNARHSSSPATTLSRLALGLPSPSSRPEAAPQTPHPPPPSVLKQTLPSWAQEAKEAREVHAPSPLPKLKLERTSSSPSSQHADLYISHLSTPPSRPAVSTFRRPIPQWLPPSAPPEKRPDPSRIPPYVFKRSLLSSGRGQQGRGEVRAPPAPTPKPTNKESTPHLYPHPRTYQVVSSSATSRNVAGMTNANSGASLQPSTTTSNSPPRLDLNFQPLSNPNPSISAGSVAASDEDTHPTSQPKVETTTNEFVTISKSSPPTSRLAVRRLPSSIPPAKVRPSTIYEWSGTVREDHLEELVKENKEKEADKRKLRAKLGGPMLGLFRGSLAARVLEMEENAGRNR